MNLFNRTRKKKRKIAPRARKTSPGRISYNEAFRLTSYTVIYALFIMVVAGLMKVYFEDLYYFQIGKLTIPLDVQEGFFTMALVLWAGFVLMLGIKYKLE